MLVLTSLTGIQLHVLVSIKSALPTKLQSICKYNGITGNDINYIVHNTCLDRVTLQHGRTYEGTTDLPYIN